MKLRSLWSILVAIPIAANATGGSGGPATTITSVTVDSWDQLINITGSWGGNPDGCGVHTFAVIQMSTPNYKDMLAAALMASAAGKTVSLWFNTCLNTPWGNAPIITSITVN